MLTTANEFILENKKSVNPNFRLNYHFMADIGWINDSNGFVYFKNEYHLFFQYYPYDSKNIVMYWGHAKSKDLIHWEQLPVALAPDADYDKDGCWSGSAIVVDDTLYILYTGNQINNGKTYQTQNLAYSTDGINFTKCPDNPVIKIDADFKDGSIHDNRDPFLFKDHGIFKTIIGTKKDDKSRLLQFESLNLKTWKYSGIVYENDRLGKMFECPNMPSKNLLIISPQDIQNDGFNYWNFDAVVGITGRYKNNKFKAFHIQELDHGLEFYAPQAVNINGRILMTPWLQMWGRRFPLDELSHKWTNCFGLFREVRIKNNKIVQKPIKELKKYISKPVKLKGKENSIELCSKLSFSFNSKTDSSIVLKDDENEFIISFDSAEKVITIDRTKCKEKLLGIENNLASNGIRKLQINKNNSFIKLDIYLDRISVEMFINNGEETMSSLCYFKNKNIKLINNNLTTFKYSTIRI